jgi:hypothetical protein
LWAGRGEVDDDFGVGQVQFRQGDVCAVGVGAAMVGVDGDFGRHWAWVCGGVGGGGAVGVGGHFAGRVEGCSERWYSVS